MTASFSPTDERDRIDQQASEWVVLLSDRELSSRESREFEAWLAADPRHRAAWRELGSIWGTIPALPGLSDLLAADEDVADCRENRWAHLASRRAVAAVAAIAAVLVALLLVPAVLSQPEHYRTGVAQTQLITLQDGSQVALGPLSDLTVEFHDGERRIALAGGEAFFEIEHDKSQPFIVEAGAAQTRVLGTKFNVNYTLDSVRVGVLEGLVQVSRSSPDRGRRPAMAFVRAGQGAEVSLSAGGDPITLRAAPAPGAWREGRLIYENSRLADLAADVNRYYSPGVVLADPQVGELRITASFKPSDIAAFMSAVGDVVPVKATEASDGSFRLEAVQE